MKTAVHMFGFVTFAAILAACGGGGGGSVTPVGGGGGGGGGGSTPTPRPTPAALQQQAVTASGGGTVTAALPGGGSVSVLIPPNVLSGNATVTIYAYTQSSQLGIALSSLAREPKSLPAATTFLAGFAIDTGTAVLLAPVAVTETLQSAVPTGDALRVARFGINGFSDVDTATLSNTSATNDLNSSYVSVSGGGTSAPYVIYAAPVATLSTPAPITITATAPSGQQIDIGGSGTFTVSGQDANGNPLPFTPTFDTDNHAIATAAVGNSPLSAMVTATEQGGQLHLLATDPRTGTVGKTAFTVDTQRPANAGDAFAFSGTLTRADTYTYPSPNPLPSTSVSDNVTQTTTSVSATSCASGDAQFHTVESDAYPTQTFGTTTDACYALGAASAGIADFELLGYNAVDDQGNTTAVQYGTPQIVDELPEASGQTWTNSSAMTLTQNFVGGETVSRTVNADGSYQDTENIYQGTGGANYPATTSIITQNPDGSAVLDMTFADEPYAQSAEIKYLLSAPVIPAPSATPSITLSEEEMFTVSTPAPSPTPTTLFSVGSWFNTPLFSESDANIGTKAFPTACKVPSGFGTSGLELQQVVTRVDAALGTLETTTTSSFVATGFGPVCTQVADTTQVYYDYNPDTPYFAYYSGAGTPLQTTTIQQTLTLQQSGTAVTPQSRVRSSSVELQPISPAVVEAARVRVQSVAQQNRAKRVLALTHHIFHVLSHGGAR